MRKQQQPPAAPEPPGPVLNKDGTLAQAWTDDTTGKTYMPGERLEDGDDGD